jgi:hypothetical protein
MSNSKKRPVLPRQTTGATPDPKLAKVRAAIAQDDWDEAIKLAARVTLFGKHAEAIQRGKDALLNPDMYRQLGRDPEKIRAEAIAALQERVAAADKAGQNADAG